MNKRLLTYLLISFIVFGLPIILPAQENQPASPVIQRPQQKPPDTKQQLALKYYREKEYAKAAELFEQLYDSKRSGYLYSYLYNCYIQLNKYDSALRIARQQRKQSTNNYRFIIDEAYVTDLTGNKKKALKMLNKLVDELPKDRNIIIQITNSLISKGYAELAVNVYIKANAENNGNYSYGFELANAYMYSGDYSLMFDSFLNHLEMVPTDLQRVKSKLQMVMRMDVNSNLTEMLREKLLQRSQASPDNTLMAEMLLWYSLQTKDFDMAYRQARALDVRFENGDKSMMELANVAFSNNDFKTAEKAFKYIKDKKQNTIYFTDAYVGYFLSRCKVVEEDPLSTNENYIDLEKEGIKAIDELGINNLTSNIINELSKISAFKLGKFNEAEDMLEKALSFPAVNKIKESELKITLADILLAKGKIWDATLLYSQVESTMKNEPIGHEAKLKNAKVFYYVGEFDWAATKLDVLKSATSKLISNDAIELSLFIKEMRDEDTLGFILRKFAGADLYAYQQKYDSALILLEKINDEPFGYVGKEYALFKSANIFLKMGRYEEADSAFSSLISMYPGSVKTDNAYFGKAETLILLGKTEEAKKIYLDLMTNYPESIFAGKARKRYRSFEQPDLNTP